MIFLLFYLKSLPITAENCLSKSSSALIAYICRWPRVKISAKCHWQKLRCWPSLKISRFTASGTILCCFSPTTIIFRQRLPFLAGGLIIISLEIFLIGTLDIKRSFYYLHICNQILIELFLIFPYSFNSLFNLYFTYRHFIFILLINFCSICAESIIYTGQGQLQDSS